MIGQRVRVKLPSGCSDPWLKDKNGWEGLVRGNASIPGHYSVEFLPPWCELKRPRIMPEYVLCVLRQKTKYDVRQFNLPM